MRLRASTLGPVLLIATLATTTLTGIAWSQAGRVMSHQKISQTQGNFTATLDNLDEFGNSTANLGDLDGPGPSVVAVAVGAFADDDGGPDRGAVHILFLNAAGSVLSSAKISDTEGNFTAIIDNVDEFGASVANLGDLDGPGPSVVALAVGAPGDDDGGLDRGAIYVLFLASSGSVLSYTKISDTAGNFTAIIDNADEVGGAIANLGDLDGAGASVIALAVSATGDDDGGINRGAIYVLFMNAAGSVLNFQKTSDTQGTFTAILDDADEFGTSLANLGDLDGAGPSVRALAVGAFGDDDGGNARGAVYVLFLSAAGNVLSYQKISSTAGNFTEPLEDNDEIGNAVAPLGDLDGPGPGVVTLAVNAAGDDDGGSGRGAVYVLFLSSAGTVVSYQKISQLAGGFTGAMTDGEQFGGSLAALGDLDGAGPATQTLAVGANGDDDGGTDRGAVFVLFLSGGSPVAVDGPSAVVPAPMLGAARPNPFHPRTSITFRIGEPARVEIRIWDVNGRSVRRLLDDQAAAGEHRAEWDGRDDAGRALPSGTYFYRMTVNGQTLSTARKAVVLR